jgi:hypothetical protein
MTGMTRSCARMLAFAAAVLIAAPGARAQQESPQTDTASATTPPDSKKSDKSETTPRLRGGRKTGTDMASPRPAAGQTLEDVVRAARQTRAKRSGGAEKRVVISNRTLKKYDKGHLTTVNTPPQRQAAPNKQEAAKAAGTDGKGPEAAKAPEEPKAQSEKATRRVDEPLDDEGHGETWWRAQLAVIRTRIDNEAHRQTTLQGEIARLENDFYRWDDPAYRDSVIKPAWDKAREDAEENSKDLANDRKLLADELEHARKVGAWPGWLRE